MDFKIDYIIDDIHDCIEMSLMKKDSDIVEQNTKGDIFEFTKKLAHVISNLHPADQAIIFGKLDTKEREFFINNFSHNVSEDIITFLETINFITVGA